MLNGLQKLLRFIKELPTSVLLSGIFVFIVFVWLMSLGEASIYLMTGVVATIVSVCRLISYFVFGDDV